MAKTKKALNEHWKNVSPSAKELVLFADNDSHLHKNSHHPIMANLAKKAKKGVYDPKLAAKLWGYHADRAAVKYHKEMGEPTDKWHKAWPKAVRDEAAGHWEEFHRDELKTYKDEEKHKMLENINENEEVTLESEEPDMSNHYKMLDTVIQGKASEFQDIFNKTVLGKLRINVEAVKEAMRPTLFTGQVQEEIDGEQLEEGKNPLLARLGA